MPRAIPAQEQEPAAARTASIYVLSGEAGRLLLANEQESGSRYTAYTYGLQESGVPLPEDKTVWEADAKEELARITKTVKEVGKYATMILGLAKGEHQKHTQARTDSLSGLPNRLGFYDELEYAIRWQTGRLAEAKELEDGSRRPAETARGLGVGKVDLDYFKDINDTLGHKVGDKVIEMLGDCLRRVTRLPGKEEPDDEKAGEAAEGEDKRSEQQDFYPDWDFIARVGGDEFSIIQHVHEGLAREDGEGAISIAQALQAAQERIEKEVAEEMVKINKYLQDECVRRGKPPIAQIKARFGWRNYQSGDNEAIIERETDIALYKNKHDGKVEDATEDRKQLTRGEIARVRNIVTLLDNPKYARYRRTVADLKQLLGLAA